MMSREYRSRCHAISGFGRHLGLLGRWADITSIWCDCQSVMFRHRITMRAFPNLSGKNLPISTCFAVVCLGSWMSSLLFSQRYVKLCWFIPSITCKYDWSYLSEHPRKLCIAVFCRGTYLFCPKAGDSAALSRWISAKSFLVGSPKCFSELSFLPVCETSHGGNLLTFRPRFFSYMLVQTVAWSSRKSEYFRAYTFP